MKRNDKETKSGVEIVSEFAKGWKGRGRLEDLVKELDRQKEAKLDFIADSRTLRVQVGGTKTGAKVNGPLDRSLHLTTDDLQTGEWLTHPHPMRANAIQQLGQRLSPDIPWQFLKRLSEHRPDRSAKLLNGLMQDLGQRRMIRCMDGHVRSILSHRYRILDHYDIAFKCLDTARQFGGEVIEASLSDSKMRIKFISRDVWDVIENVRHDPNSGNWYAGGLGNGDFLKRVGARETGDLPGGPGTVHPVVTIDNSETGQGGYNVRIGFLMGICFNLAIVESVAARVHLGASLEAGIFSPETMNLDSQAIMAKAQDAVGAAFKHDVFKKLVAKANKAQDHKIEAPAAAIDNIVATTTVKEGDRDRLLEYFIRDYNQTAFGLSQAVSRLAQDTDDADASSELEEAAGRIISSPAAVSLSATAGFTRVLKE